MRNGVKGLILWSLFSASILLTGCNSSSDKTTENIEPDPTGIEPIANLTISKIDANSLATYRQGDTLTVHYQLDVSELDQPDVTINFYLVHNIGTENNSTEQRVENTHLLSSMSHSAVPNGSYAEVLSTTIPAVEEGGQYWVVAVVDPYDETAEDDETDNYPNHQNEAYSTGEFPAVVLQIDTPPEHDFEILDTEINGGVVILDSPAIHTGTGERHSDIIGHVNAIYRGTNSGTALLTAEVEINGNYEATQLWNATSQSYQDTQKISFQYNNDKHFFGFDIALTDAQLQALYDDYSTDLSNQLKIRYTLNNADDETLETELSNNSVVTTASLFFFEGHQNAEKNSLRTFNSTIKKSSSTLSIDGSYDQSYGDESSFKVGVDLGGELTADLIDQAAAFEASGEVDMWIFDAENTIFGISFSGQAYLSGVNTGYDSEMVIFNTTVFEDSNWVSQFEETFEKTWEEEQTLVEATFTVGIVPVTVEAGIDGSVGFELTVGYALSELYTTGDIFSTDFGGFASGGVDLAIASAGVTMDLTIIDNALSLDSSASLALLEDDTNPGVEYSFALTDDIDVINGKFGLYAEVTSITWCSALGIPYPCGTDEETYYLWFYQTDSVYSKSWTIYSAEGTIYL